MATWDFLLDILILLGAALLLGTVAELLRQSAILGYLAAGTIVGPNVLGLVGRGGGVEIIAELGVAVLLFTIGLEFSLRRLKRLGRVALLGGCLQVVATMAIAGVLAAIWLPWRGAVAVGAMIALSSTACVVRMLVDRRMLESIYGRNAIGILLFQDAAVIPLLLLVVTLGGAQGAADTALLLGKTVLLAVALIGGLLVLLNVIIPRLLNIQLWARHRELPILLAIILALGSAAAAHALSLSPSMGAFVAGVLLGGSPFSAQIRADVGSLRALLVTLFFASIGMLGEPAWALEHWYLVLGAVAAVIAGKAVVIWGVLRALGYRSGVSAATGLCLAQVGEFSFVLADVARGSAPNALIGDETFRLIVSATILTLFLTPFLATAAPRVADWLEERRRARVGAAGVEPSAAVEQESGEPPTDIMIIGYGPAGQAVCNALYGQHRARIMVLDLNPRNVQTARRLGLAARIGDATHGAVLEAAGIERASVVCLTIPDPAATRTIIHLCRRIVPDAAVVARSRYHVRRWELELAGAREVIDEEENVGLRIAASARKYIGQQSAISDRQVSSNQ